MYMRLAETPEFALQLAVCRWPNTKVEQQAVCRAAAQVTDWPLFLRMVARQRVWALALGALQNAGAALPDDVGQYLKRTARKIAEQNCLLSVEIIRLQQNLAAAGVTAVFIKGVVLADRVYGSIAVKHGKDIDIWVMPDHLSAAWACLETLGYRQQWLSANHSEALRHRLIRYQKEMSFRLQSGAEVELHWRLSDNPDMMTFPHRDDLVVLPFAGEPLHQFTDDALFCYLALHGAQHGWYRLKWLADFNAFLSGKDCTELYRYAVDRHMGLFAGYGLMLCHRYFETPLSADVLHEISGWRVRLLCRITHWILTGRPALKEPLHCFALRMALRPVWLLQCTSFRAWFRHMSATVFSCADMQKYPLPHGLFFLYPLLRFPLWCVRRIRWRCTKKTPTTA